MGSPERRLPPAARAGARLEAGGSGPAEIARELNVSLSTVRAWRQRPDYRAVRDQLVRQGDAAVMDLVVEVRRSALDCITDLVNHLSKRVPDMRDRDAAAALGVMVDAYRLMAEQTGIGAPTRVEVSVITPEQEAEAARRLISGLTSNTPANRPTESTP